jgi:4-oxalocrotonate tautomerase family enzyme
MMAARRGSTATTKEAAMPVIIVKARQGVIEGKAKKAQMIEEMAATFARVIENPGYVERTTVVIEEVPSENWGRAGRQVQDE